MCFYSALCAALIFVWHSMGLLRDYKQPELISMHLCHCHRISQTFCVKNVNYFFRAVLSFAAYLSLSAAPKRHISALGHAAFVRDLSFLYILSVQHWDVLSVIHKHTSFSVEHTHTHTHSPSNQITMFSTEPVGDSRERGVDGWGDKW